MKTTASTFTFIAVGCILVGGLGCKRPASDAHSDSQQANATQVAAPVSPAAKIESTTTQAPPPQRKQKQWQDPEARKALSQVGVDHEAEQYWMKAINNPNLPAKERQDLIEDLNEEGLPNPKNLTDDDLLVIMWRIELIEKLLPEAMDDVNAAAFEEAHKDLTKMLSDALGR